MPRDGRKFFGKLIGIELVPYDQKEKAVEEELFYFPLPLRRQDEPLEFTRSSEDQASCFVNRIWQIPRDQNVFKEALCRFSRERFRRYEV